MQTSPSHTAFRFRTGRSTARFRCPQPENGQNAVFGTIVSGAGVADVGRAAGPAAASGSKQPRIASATDVPLITSRNGTEGI